MLGFLPTWPVLCKKLALNTIRWQFSIRGGHASQPYGSAGDMVLPYSRPFKDRPMPHQLHSRFRLKNWSDLRNTQRYFFLGTPSSGKTPSQIKKSFSNFQFLVLCYSAGAGSCHSRGKTDFVGVDCVPYRVTLIINCLERRWIVCRLETRSAKSAAYSKSLSVCFGLTSSSTKTFTLSFEDIVYSEGKRNDSAKLPYAVVLVLIRIVFELIGETVRFGFLVFLPVITRKSPSYCKVWWKLRWKFGALIYKSFNPITILSRLRINSCQYQTAILGKQKLN